MSDTEIQDLYAASCRRLLALSLVLLVTACSSSTSADRAATTMSPSPSEAATTPSPSPSEQAEAFPVSAFVNMSADPVSEERAEEFQVALSEMSEWLDGAGMSATVLSPAGTWSGAVGKADSRRVVGDQFAIGSVTKSLVAAPPHMRAPACRAPVPAADQLNPQAEGTVFQCPTLERALHAA